MTCFQVTIISDDDPDIQGASAVFKQNTITGNLEDPESNYTDIVLPVPDDLADTELNYKLSSRRARSFPDNGFV